MSGRRWAHGPWRFQMFRVTTRRRSTARVCPRGLAGRTAEHDIDVTTRLACQGGLGHDPHVALEHLTDAERAWVEADERLWQRAHAIAARHPGVDIGGVYHVLRNLQRSPSERLRRGLAFGRLGAH